VWKWQSKQKEDKIWSRYCFRGAKKIMNKILIWGIGILYNRYKNNIAFEVLKNNINVVAMISKEKMANWVDGKRVISKEEISQYEYDYIVVFTQSFNEIVGEATALGIPRKKIIDGRVFEIPCFDFARYSSLIENPVTIISDDCWGGTVYHHLGLETTSPFKNFYLKNHDYIKLCNSLEHYLKQELKIEQEGNLEEGVYPIGSLGTGEEKIKLYFNHFLKFETAYGEWEKRKKRINWERIFIKMAVPH